MNNLIYPSAFPARVGSNYTAQSKVRFQSKTSANTVSKEFLHFTSNILDTLTQCVKCTREGDRSAIVLNPQPSMISLQRVSVNLTCFGVLGGAEGYIMPSQWR